MAIELKFTFDNEEEVRAFLESRDATAAEPAEPVVAAEPAEPVVAAEPAEPAAEESDEPTRDDVDADNMPYDESVHADPPSFTAKGMWRSARGKSEEANAARARFKAQGGTVTPPEDIQQRAAPTMPGAAPAAPGAAPAASAPPPVTIEALFGKISEMLEGGAIERSDLFVLYRETTGVEASDDDLPTMAGSVFQTNETARAKLMAELDNI